MPKLSHTTQAEPRVVSDGRRLHPVNVCTAGTASCLKARMWKDSLRNYLSLAHFPSTAVLVEY